MKPATRSKSDHERSLETAVWAMIGILVVVLITGGASLALIIGNLPGSPFQGMEKGL